MNVDTLQALVKKWKQASIDILTSCDDKLLSPEEAERRRIRGMVYAECTMDLLDALSQ